MAKQPAVVIIARHGARLDAADQQWHLATPTPYDPPLTYGGWTQCRTLGGRIASLLETREQAADVSSSGSQTVDGVSSYDFASSGTRKRKRKHKVVIHSSPFLRCLQTSVAIAAGMAQHQPSNEAARKPSVGHRSPTQLHSASPKLKAMEGSRSPTLAPIAEPRGHDFAHDLARKALTERKKYRRAKLRVDAFLGEWLNPQYFEHITHPPPSAMMVTAAKAELMQNEPIDTFTPSISTTRTPSSSLWGGVNGTGSSKSAGTSRSGTMDDLSHLRLEDPSPAPTTRSRASSEVGSTISAGGPPRPKSPYRSGHFNMTQNSTIPKQETSQYIAPTPSWAVSSSDVIPRGYVSHARQACTNVDFQWDSSRSPQAWGDGGDYGEEWSSMHKRFRRGLNNVVDWYSHHSADDRGEDALGFDQAEKHLDEIDDDEDLVIILVTHGAGCNALIGAMTGQPVLLDVGMASLTMAVRKDNAPPAKPTKRSSADKPDSPQQTTLLDGYRRESLDTGLSSVYEMRLVASSEHLRPGADTRKPSVPPSAAYRDNLPRFRENFEQTSISSPLSQNWRFGEPTPRNSGSTSAALGSIRRPSVTSPPASTATAPPLAKANTTTAVPTLASLAPTPATGLWTPPSARTPSPALSAFQTTNPSSFETPHPPPSSEDLVLDFSNSPPSSRPQTSAGSRHPSDGATSPTSLTTALQNSQQRTSNQSNETAVQEPPMATSSEESDDGLSDLPKPAQEPPQALQRGLSQKGLWGARPTGDRIRHPRGERGPKRRWTLDTRE